MPWSNFAPSIYTIMIKKAIVLFGELPYLVDSKKILE